MVRCWSSGRSHGPGRTSGTVWDSGTLGGSGGRTLSGADLVCQALYFFGHLHELTHFIVEIFGHDYLKKGGEGDKDMKVEMIKKYMNV